LWCCSCRVFVCELFLVVRDGDGGPSCGCLWCCSCRVFVCVSCLFLSGMVMVVLRVVVCGVVQVVCVCVSELFLFVRDGEDGPLCGHLWCFSHRGIVCVCV